MDLIDSISRVAADYDWENPNEDRDPLQAVLGARALSAGEVQGWKLDLATEQAYLAVVTAGDQELAQCLREHFLIAECELDHYEEV